VKSLLYGLPVNWARGERKKRIMGFNSNFLKNIITTRSNNGRGIGSARRMAKCWTVEKSGFDSR
jgi:hypothetical protein